jgi:AcrR family transcriptional regulator
MRDRILDATERLLGRLGYQKTTMDDIAHDAAIGRRTIYLHFATKEEVALATIDRIVDRLKHALRLVANSPQPPADRLKAMLQLRVMFRFDSVRDYYHSIDEIFRSLRGPYMARRARYFTEEAALLAQVLSAGRDNGLLRFDDAETTAHLLLLATNSLLPSSLSTAELGERKEVEARITGIANLLVKGLETQSIQEPMEATPPLHSRRIPTTNRSRPSQHGSLPKKRIKG